MDNISVDDLSVDLSVDYLSVDDLPIAVCLSEVCTIGPPGEEASSSHRG